MIEATLLLALRNSGTELLLGLKKTGKLGRGTFNGPGGRREAGESLLECVVRETHEEVGLTVDTNTLEKCAILNCYAAGEVYLRVHVFLARSMSGEPVETESMKPYWWAVYNLPFEHMLEADLLWLPKVLAGEKMCADVHYREPGTGLERFVQYPFVDTE